ncbi:BEN domain-containing protein 2 [Phacochoerus africanus]|uniref:BEN domain-containing protein 2 n=1 Tax=Phacochoerus africanus TaxID=41426 RepID=UPI001FDAB7CC|nr:BEN domain-containing protein 2 [Phacochoerus africanus]
MRQGAPSRLFSLARQEAAWQALAPEPVYYVIITIEDDSDADDDVDIVIIEESDTEDTENTFSTDEILTVETDFQDDSDNSQQPSHLSYEVEDLVVLGDQAVSQMNHLATLKRYSPNSAEMEFIPLPKKGRLSVPGEDNMQSPSPPQLGSRGDGLCWGAGRPCLVILRQPPSLPLTSWGKRRAWRRNALQVPTPLPTGANKRAWIQLSADLSPDPLNGKDISFFEKPTMTDSLDWGDCSPSLPEQRQESGDGTNPVGPSLQSAALPELQQPVLMESPPLPRIVSTFSLQPCTTPSSPFPVLAIPSYFFSEGTESTNGVISSAEAAPAVPAAVLPQGEPSLADTAGTMNYSTIMENNSVGADTALPSLCIPPNFEMPGKAATGLGNSTKSMHYPTFLGSDSGQDTISSSVFSPPNFAEKFILIEMPGKAETTDTSMENSSQTMYYPALVGNGSGPDAASSRLSIPPNFEMFLKAETSMENNPQMMNYPPFLEDGCAQETSYFFIPPGFESSTEMKSETTNYPTVMENDSGQDIDSETFFLTHGFALLPIEILVKAENCVENDPETMNDSTVLENVNSQDSSSSSFCIPSNFGYLGDPKRNVRMLDIHLMTTQKKATPKHAACYLISILFSKEMLMSSSVGVTSQGRQPLDPNKMAAIREHLAAIFPNHDLRECGKDWQACISDINSLIGHLCSEAKRTPASEERQHLPSACCVLDWERDRSSPLKEGPGPAAAAAAAALDAYYTLVFRQKTVDNNKEPPNRDAPKCADSHDKRDGDGGSQLPRRAAFSETGENENSQQNSSVLPEEIKELSTNNSTVSYETLEYFGNPWRNIWMPKSVLNTAKKKSRPELSARYLIQNLFTEEVLIKCNIFGSLGRGTCACSANKINALREFLQDIYPTCDLSETGYDWKLCVTAINSCIRSLRYDFKKSTSKSQPPPAATLSTESEPRDTDLAD